MESVCGQIATGVSSYYFCSQFVRSNIRPPGCLQQELDLDGLEREDDTAAFYMINNARIEQGGDITMDCFDITPDSSRCLTSS